MITIYTDTGYRLCSVNHNFRSTFGLRSINAIDSRANPRVPRHSIRGAAKTNRPIGSFLYCARAEVPRSRVPRIVATILAKRRFAPRDSVYTKSLVKMNAIWNLSTLERPPYATWQIGPQDAKKKGVDITRFKTILTTAIHDLELNDLDENAAVLSRLIYRMKSKFRNDKGLGHMIKLNNALLRYHNMSLKKEYTTLRSDLRTEDGMYVLPSRQILEYVLVRTQGFAKLMARTEEIARCASHFLRGRIKLGHAWSVALVAYATTSRIWFHARFAIRKCCKMYDELYRCAEQFQYVGAKPWLPTDQSLPRNLRSWLGLLWIDPMKLRQTWQTFQRILGEIECDNTKTTFIIPNDEKTDGSRLTQVDIASTNNVLEDKPISNNDIGEVVDREAFEKSLPPSDRSITTKRKHSDTDEGKPKEPKRKNRK